MAAEPFTDQTKNNGQTKNESAAPDTDRASAAPNTEQAADSTVGSLDSLLAGGTAGPVSQFRPDASLARWALRLASQPGTVARQAVKLTADMTSIALGSSEIAAPRRDRRFSDPAWTGNPLLKRTLQMYLALGGTAQDLLADADLDWRDNTRLQFLLTNFIAASAPSNNPALNPGAWPGDREDGQLALAQARQHDAVETFGDGCMAGDPSDRRRAPNREPSCEAESALEDMLRSTRAIFQMKILARLNPDNFQRSFKGISRLVARLRIRLGSCSRRTGTIASTLHRSRARRSRFTKEPW